MSIVGQNVCVIGGAGFLGSHLVNHLIDDRNCKVLVLDNLCNGLRKHVHPRAEFRWFDIRSDTELLADLLRTRGIRYVFNYAAEPYIPECFERPLHFFDINARAVLQVMNACQMAEVYGLLQVSSAEIYGDLNGKAKETDQVSPHSTYGVSKLAADQLVGVRWKEAQLPAIGLRQFNCIGERETHEYVVPEIISQLFNHYGTDGKPVESVVTVKLGNNSKRDFIYAGDAVRIAVELLEHGQFGEVYNLGSESSIQIYSLATVIGQIIGFEHVVVEPDPERVRPWEIWHLQSDNTKIYSVVKQRPKVSLPDALRRTVDYFIDNGSKWDWKGK